MRVLLVTWSDQLLEKLSILNPELEYCAIVIEEVEPAKKILERVGLPETLLHPLYDLKECIGNFYYDYVLCVERGWDRDFLALINEYGVPKNKIVGLNFLCNDNFLDERALRYFKAHATEFDMFATGLSYTEFGLDVTRFKYKLFNFGRGSQDLYYNFQVAKRVILYGGGHNKLRYALIGLPIYCFHHDLSKASNLSFLMLHYLITFGDLHNFHMSAENYAKFLRKEYFSTKLPIEPIDLNNVFYSKTALRFMTRKSYLETRKIIETVSEKYFPETRDENIKILDDYLTLCEENNIRPIIFLPPTTEGYKKHFSKLKRDEFYWLIGQACRKHSSAIFIDGWQLQGVTNRDFYDYGHMNIQGAAKFSTFLNNFIEQIERR